ncbi:PAS-domain containing protein [Defluviimonas sp. WL0002]|uniref:PAS-domain containing protein n=1 Tax=Albidovulum marisflavi TaxID=2984159 RepID=A0ABT2Z834_9RHOB|nr:PAS domain-containing protein [Defluviimonas sp. WL0002]MCV2867258.1 PAS-domain containing protein [Defluviimonas sp. WL0002]
MSPALVFAVIVAASAFAAAATAVLTLILFEDWRRVRQQASDPGPHPKPHVFLFEDRELVDTNSSACSLLCSLPAGPSDWLRLMAYLAPRFADLAPALENGAGAGGLTLRAKDGGTLEITGGKSLLLRLAYIPGGAQDEPAPDVSCRRAQQEELDCLRETLDALPLPIWRTSADGTVLWVNRAYVAVAATSAGCSEDELAWPLPNLLDRAPPARSEEPRRLRLAGSPSHWLQIETVALPRADLHVALPADALVQAETTREEMMQTLAKTFAGLPIGLAVFDCKRQLVLFNPALADLTDLRPEFLMTRPQFHAFFDRLRDQRMIPEPRNYHTWRQEIADIESAAASGHYEDTWNLPSGVTYRVTAHPHPDGALALWFADVSADISLTRRFRAELQTCQEVFDQLETAIAVFSAAGVMTLSNSAFSGLWGFDATLAVAPVDVADMIALWQAQTDPSPVWEALLRHLSDLDARETWSGTVRTLVGTSILVSATPLGGGATMLSFDTNAATATKPAARSRMLPLPAL